MIRQASVPATPHVLMCPPDYYGINYEINPWMSRRRPSDPSRSWEQWRRLRGLIEEAGAAVSCLPPVPGLPDLVFTANAALLCGHLAIPSRFRHPQRQAEQSYQERWLEACGYQLRWLPDGCCFEGAGDCLFCGDTLYAGYRQRSDVRAHHAVARMLGCRVIPLELIDPYYYHLDTAFCPLDVRTAIYHPGAFDEYGRKVLQESIANLLPVPELEARRFACNAVVIGRTVILNEGCPETQRQLRAHEFQPRETPLDEFAKAGGSAKCLTLRLDGEEAAAWKYAPPLATPSPGESRAT